METALIFDVETTGLLPKKSTSPMYTSVDNLAIFPHIIQFSCILYDIKTETIWEKYNAYIRIPDHVQLTEHITELTGITKEMCEGGINIMEAIEHFHVLYEKCDYLVAHNIDFDSKMIMTEIKRNMPYLDHFASLNLMFCKEYNKLKNKKMVCTMMKSIYMCNIKVVSKNGKPYKKFPRLSELYFVLFNEIPENLHNSLVDTIVTLKCYLKLCHNITMDNTKYHNMLNDNGFE